MKCKLCNSSTVLLETIQSKKISKEYKRQLDIEIIFLAEELQYYHCPFCKIKFFSANDDLDISGDNFFYNLINKKPWYYLDEKYEYQYARQFIRKSDIVLEVGSGKGAFAKYIPNVKYIGLELSTDAKKDALNDNIVIHNVSIQDYAKINPGSVDVVCSFQVLEHINEPSEFLKSSLTVLKGGGATDHSCT